MDNKTNSLEENILDFERELKELSILYKDGRIPYKFIQKRIEEICSYLREDIREELYKLNN